MYNLLKNIFSLFKHEFTISFFMKTKRIAIIGGGLAGITAAKLLSEESDKNEIVIFESSDSLGGLQKSYKINNLHYDAGAYLYTELHQIFELFPELKQYFVKVAHKEVLITQEYTIRPFPYSLNNFIKDKGYFSIFFILTSMLRDKFIHRNYTDIEGYCKYFAGNYFYQKSGLIDYVRRFHANIDTSIIDKEFGEQRIASLQYHGLRKFIKRKLGFSNNKTIVKNSPFRFVRPYEGFPFLFKKMEEILIQKAINIKFNQEIENISKVNNEFLIRHKNQNLDIFDEVIFSTPLITSCKLLNYTLPFLPKHIHLLSLFYCGNVDIEANMVYNFSQIGQWKRMIIFSRYYGKVNELDYFTVEIPIINTSSEEIQNYINDFEQFITKTTYFSQTKLQGQKVLYNAYPLLDKEVAAKKVETIEKIEQLYGVSFLGRQGKHEFLNSSPIIAQIKQNISQIFKNK